MNHFTRIILTVLIILGCDSCHGQNVNIKNHPKECIKLNDEGVDSLMKYPGRTDATLDKAIELFKQAITCDSTNIVFYMSLSSAYDEKHNDVGVMAMFNKVLNLTNNDPFFLFEKGMLYERLGNVDSANRSYQFAQQKYDERLKKRYG